MFLKETLPVMQRVRERNGAGLRLLTGRITSPTLQRQLADLLKAFPDAGWYVHDPVGDEAAVAGARLAFGRPLDTLPLFDRVQTILCLDADPLGPGPAQIRNARHWSARRNPDIPGDFSRFYVLHSTGTLTSAKADNRLALHPADIQNAAVSVANALGARLPEATLPPAAASFVEAVAQDLLAHRGEALVLAGRTLPAETHALVHWINRRLDAPISAIEPVDGLPGHSPGSLKQLGEDLDAEQVEALVVLGCNPAYDASGNFDLASALAHVPFSLHVGPYADETAALCRWHVPESHPLEAWSDLRGVDGTASLVQPLIRPLYGTWTAHHVLAALMGHPGASDYDAVRETWRGAFQDDFETRWRQALHDGVVAGTQSPPVAVPEPALVPAELATAPQGHSVVLSPDPCLWDGSVANNAWLQECPKPLTKQVWGHALEIAPADASRLGLQTGDSVRIESGKRSVTVPVLVAAGCAPGVASLTLGYGRSRAGAVGTGIGANAFSLRTQTAHWHIPGTELVKVEDRQEVLQTQTYVALTGDARDLFPTRSLAELNQGAPVDHNTGPYPSLYPEDRYQGHAWAMVIDAQACIGCNACVVACQTENNVPVVGPQEIAQGRDMHWLRIDIYDHGTPERPQQGFQPVPCMHCEKAPCEPVCPVEASVHDHEGLNVQVYNRCVGTRFCEANCPYKVRQKERDKDRD